MTNVNSHWRVVHSRVEEKAAGHLLRQGYDISFRDTSSGAGTRGVAKASQCRSSRDISSFRLIAKCSAGDQFNQPLASVSLSIMAKPLHHSRRRSLPSRATMRTKVALCHWSGDRASLGGDQIRIVDGIFDDCLGLFEDMVDHERVAILLDLLGRKARVVLHGDAVAAA
jgi:hypothetical protein